MPCSGPRAGIAWPPDGQLCGIYVWSQEAQGRRSGRLAPPQGIIHSLGEHSSPPTPSPHGVDRPGSRPAGFPSWFCHQEAVNLRWGHLALGGLNFSVIKWYQYFSQLITECQIHGSCLPRFQHLSYQTKLD